jgi:hypothetical protein
VIAVFPISRCLVEQEIEICDSLTLFPPGEWEGLHLIAEPLPSTSIAALATNASGFSAEIIKGSALVVYRDDSKHLSAIGSSHKDDLFLLQKVVAECESRLDIARFDMCRLDLPDTLFGRTGTWEGSEGASGGVFFDTEGGLSYFIGGRYLVSTLTAGIGLDFDGYRPSYQHRKDEIGNVVKQALTIFRHALEASDSTSKYLHCVRLFEVLADPFQLEKSNKWEKVRSRLCSHLATDRSSYFSLADRFRMLGNVGDGSARGLRERVIHHGELLENIFDSEKELKALFREIQGYAHQVLSDVMRFDGGSWHQIDEWRDKRLALLEIKN